MWKSLFAFKPKCCMTTAWGGYCGLRFREAMLPTHLSESHYGSVPPMSAWCTLSFRMLRCCSTIISGQCFWEEQPRQWGNAGTVAAAASAVNEGLLQLLLLGMAHVFHLLGNSYGLLCNHRSLLCAATWLLCCDEVGVAKRWGCQCRSVP